MAKVTIEHIARIEASIPTGATVAVMKTALNSTICTDEPLCDVVVATSRRSLQNSLVHGRNLVTAAFTVTRSLDDTSDLSLGPPTIDTAAVATSLGLPSSTVITSTTSVQSVSASVTVVNQGSSSSPAAQAALSSAASLPSVLAGSLGVSTASISFVSSPVLIQPPMPPPRSPSPPLLSSNTASASPPQPWIQSTLPPAVGASPSSPSALDSRSDADTMEASGPDADGASLAGVGVGVGVVIFVAALIAWWYCKRLPAKALRYSSTFDESSVELHDVMGSPPVFAKPSSSNQRSVSRMRLVESTMAMDTSEQSSHVFDLALGETRTKRSNLQPTLSDLVSVGNANSCAVVSSGRLGREVTLIDFGDTPMTIDRAEANLGRVRSESHEDGLTRV